MKQEKLYQLIELLKQLRNPEAGCNWTKQQTFSSLASFTIEESYELADAINSNDTQAIKSELADLLYHVLFYTQIAQEQKLFDLDDLAETMLKKHESRMPDKDQLATMTAEEVNNYWQRKKRTVNQSSILENLNGHLPALLHAIKIQQRVSEVGFDWPDTTAVEEKIHEELQEVREATSKEHIQEEIGDLLFSVINLARHHNVDPEIALRQSNKKFISRFQALEKNLQHKQLNLHDCPIEELEATWQAVKKSDRHDNN